MSYSVNLLDDLALDRCPHCKIANPSLNGKWMVRTTDIAGQAVRCWRAYLCRACGGIVLAWASKDRERVLEVIPKPTKVDDNLPEPARSYLSQALESLHAPAGAVMLAASAVDAMLKTKGYTDGTLYQRINKAAEDHDITAEMAKWAHQVRLDANEPRHADEQSPLPTGEDARRSCEFAGALGDFMFVLPAKVNRGLDESAPQGGS